MILPKRSLSPTSVEAFARCPALFDYRHNHRLISDGYQSALTVGKAVHAAGEPLRAGGGLDAATAAAAEVFPPGEDSARDALKTAIVIEAYWRRWYKGRELTARLVANELEMRVPLINPKTGRASRTFQLHGFADAIIEHDGLRFLYEMKTTSESIREVLNWLRESIQVPMYLEMARLAGLELDGAIVDIVKKPVLKQRRSKKDGVEPYPDYLQRCALAYEKDPDRFFRRERLANSELQRHEAMQTCWRTAEAIRTSDREGYLAVRGPRCNFSYGPCRYKDICWYASMETYTHEERTDG
jgi:hypothetical protein